MHIDIGRVALLSASIGTGLNIATPALAQESAIEEEASAIIVTARRVEERLQDVPISITVYDQDQLAARNIVNSTDLATYTPSLAVNSRFGPEKASFAIRGFAQDLNTAATVGVYFADVVAPRLASNITGGNGAGVGAMFDLQNVQVLKGPQGTLFGRNTTGGAILLVPQKPSRELEGYVEGSVGNYDLRRIQAVANVPLSDTFRLRAGVDRYLRDGYLRNRSGIGPSDFNDVNFLSTRLSIVGDLTPNLENYTIFTYAHSRTNGLVSRIVACNRTGAAGLPGSSSPIRAQTCAQLDRQTARGDGFYDVENSTANPFVRSSQWQVINTTTWQASDNLTIKNIVSYGEARERYSFNITGDNGPTPSVTTYPGPNRGQGSQSTLTEELQFQGGTADNRLVWQAGGYLEQSDPLGDQEQYTAVYAKCADVYAFQCNVLPAGSVSLAKNLYTYRSYGLYAQGTYRLTEQLGLTLGIRNTWDEARVSADNIRVGFPVNAPLDFRCTRAAQPLVRNASLLTSGVCTRVFGTESSKPTWLINVDYNPTESMMIYAKYARGYRAGGVNEANVRAETWLPEKLDTYEIGLKTSFRGSISGNLNVAGFWNEFRDQQTTVAINACIANTPGCTNPPATGINGIQNVASSRLRGAEVEGMVNLFNSLRIDVGYAYLDAKVTGGGVPFCDPASFLCSQAIFLQPGSKLLLAPEHRLTASATYTLPTDKSIGEISVGATYTYTSEQFLSHNEDLAFERGVIPENYGLVPGVGLLNLNFNWKDIAGAPVDLALFATNVTKKRYRVASSTGINSAGASFIVPGEPRIFGARLRYRFGQ